MKRKDLHETFKLPLLSIGLISAAILAYEILLMHLFSIIQSHHFSSLVIALAMLGFGLSGTIVTIYQKQFMTTYRISYPVFLCLCGATMVAGFLLAQSMPLHAEQLFWDKRQLLIMAGVFISLLVPFFLGGSAICLTFTKFRSETTKIYGSDLIGAGIGSLFLLTLLFFIFPEKALVVVAGLAFAAAAISVVETNSLPSKLLWPMICIAALFLIWLGQTVSLKPSPYQTETQYLQVKGAEIISQLTSPLGYIQVVENQKIPFHHAPGLSLSAQFGPPDQLGVFINGESLTTINKGQNETERSSQYLDLMTSALPYHLESVESVLLPEPGGGNAILQAKFHNVEEIRAVELNSQITELLTHKFKDYSGDVLKAVQTFNGPLRAFLHKEKFHFDLIQFAALGSHQPALSGVSGIEENYTFTVEAINLYLNALSADGYLAVTTWVKNPPRDNLKLLKTVDTALKRSGIRDSSHHLLMIRGWQTATLVVKKSQFTADELTKARTFCRDRSFDLVYHHLLDRDQVNRYNILQHPLFFLAAKELLEGDSNTFTNGYKFNIEAATDDRPYFNNFFKWSTFEEIWHLKKQGGAALLETGYLFVFATLVLAVLISTILIFTPLFLLKANDCHDSTDSSTIPVLLYFFLTGLGFLLIEIAFIQKFTLYLNHPLYAFSTVLASFLLFSGCGSLLSKFITARISRRGLVRGASLATALLAVLYLPIMDLLFQTAATLPFAAKIVLSTAIVFPLALVMGMFFPIGLASLGAGPSHGLIPWAWGINGCGSVISSLVATLLAIHFGFSFVVILGAFCYYLLPFSHRKFATRE